MTAPIPAATLVLFRQRGRVPELLFVERSKAMVFAGGALVFPGGRIDPGDRALALELGGDPEDMAARIGAIRETIEEVGLPIGLPPMPDAIFAELRAALHRGEALGAVLRELDLALDPAQLLDGEEVFRREIPHLAGDAARQVVGPEALDRPDSAPALPERLPDDVLVGPEGTDDPRAGDDDTPSAHPTAGAPRCT